MNHKVMAPTDLDMAGAGGAQSEIAATNTMTRAVTKAKEITKA